MTNTAHAKVVIIGSGPAGYTAAIYAARAMLNPVLIQGIEPGGQLTVTTDVENYPGFADVIQGPWLMEQMAKQAAHVGAKLVPDHVNKVDLKRRPFRIECDSGDIYVADALILATGAQARWLDLPAEQKFRGYGVSACATCDGFFYRGMSTSAAPPFAVTAPRTAPVSASRGPSTSTAISCTGMRTSSGYSSVPCATSRHPLSRRKRKTCGPSEDELAPERSMMRRIFACVVGVVDQFEWTMASDFEGPRTR